MSTALVDKLLKEFIDDLENNRLVLPSLPEIAVKVRKIVDNPDASAKQLADVISQDAAIAAKLIQLANSPLLRGSKQIDSLNLAIARMGNSMVKNCVQSLIVKQLFTPSSKAAKKMFQVFMEHSAEVAALSFTLAKFAKVKPDEALLAGLVHDIGALPIIKRAEQIPDLLNDELLLTTIIEELHTRFGKELLTRWDFPPEIIKAVFEHENLTRNSPQADLTDVIMVANLQSYVDKQHPHSLIDWATVPAFAKLGLATDDSFFEELDDEALANLSQALT